MNWCENVILLATTDSTNNYAMRLIDDDKAQAGTLVLAQRQESGKGQRGRHWQDQPGESLLMSLILQPELPLNQQFSFSMAIAVAVAETVAALLPGQQVAIKWPNDIIVNDKKAGGILIENVLRGSQWLYAVAGIGINVQQAELPGLPHATSLYRNGAAVQDLTLLAMKIRNAIRQVLSQPAGAIAQQYEALLFRRGAWQRFHTQERLVEAYINGVLPDGRLHVLLADGSEKRLWHGDWAWAW